MGVAVAGERVTEPGQPLLARRHVQGAADRGGSAAAAGEEVLGGETPAVPVRQVHVAERDRSGGAGEEHR